MRLFKELSDGEIARVVSNLYGRGAAIRDCRLLKGGVFNTTYLVRTDPDGDGIVLRVAPVNRHLLFDFEKCMMSAEPLFYRMLQDQNIPTSEVVYYDNSFDVIEREYIVFRYIRSIPMNDSAVPEAVKPGIYQRLGELIARMHDIRNDKFGWKRPDDVLEMYDEWGSFLYRFAREIADRASNYGVFSDGELRKFIDVYRDPSIFNQITEASMVHADLWEGNVLVSEREGKWDIAAIIDIDKAIFGDKDMEFAFPDMLTEDFTKGYGRRLDDSPASIFRRRAYHLLSSFMYAYIWLVQYENVERYETAKRRGLSALDILDGSSRGAG